MAIQIPYGLHDIDENDIESVAQILRSSFITQGDTVPAFEKKLAQFCGAEDAVAVNSATSALHLACMSIGVSKGDWLWTSPVSFVASSNCGLYCGAKVDFVDIDPVTYNLCPDALEQKLRIAETQGRLPKVVIPVHLSGQSCDMERIYKLKEKYGFYLIEDASHAIGGTYQGSPVGSCRFSDITVFSFHPVKIITTGEGGALITNNRQFSGRARLLRSHGITREPTEMEFSADGDWYYEQVGLGYNYRMTDIQAALGLSQFKRLQTFIEKRREQAARYFEILQPLDLVLPEQSNDCKSSWHLFIARLPDSFSDVDHRRLFSKLRSHGIGVALHYIPIYRHPFYRAINENWMHEFPVAERYYKSAMSLPIYPTLSEDLQGKVAEVLAKLIAN